MNISKVIINIKYLEDNLKYLKSISKKSEIFPVIKANAYGHGLKKIATALDNFKIKGVCVATVNEIINLVNMSLSFDILHLGKIDYSNFKFYCNSNVISTINSYKDVQKIINLSKDKYIIRAHIKVDTGMSRMGCNINEFEKILNKCNQTSCINIEGIYTHLANSDNNSIDYNQKQISLFHNVLYKTENIYNYKIHILNSGGLFNYSDQTFDIVRLGLSIYGISPLGRIDKNLKPVMEFKAPIVMIKNIVKGKMIGYGCSFTAKNNMRIAIVQCGYADGIPFHYSNKGFVFFKKNKIKIIGRVSMDLIAVSIGDVNCSEGDWVTIWGGQDEDSRLENIASMHKEIPYTYITGITQRVEREYILD